MLEPQAKGDSIQSVLNQIIQKWGREGLKAIEASPDDYRMEQWYDFSELCGILARVKGSLGKNNPLTVYQLGLNSIKNDERWQSIFRDRDPAEIFLSTKRQEGQYKGGTQQAERLGPKHVRVTLVGWNCDSVWYDFYRGRLQGVLETTGRCGVVHLIPAEGLADDRVYDIKWG